MLSIIFQRISYLGFYEKAHRKEGVTQLTTLNWVKRSAGRVCVVTVEESLTEASEPQNYDYYYYYYLDLDFLLFCF